MFGSSSSVNAAAASAWVFRFFKASKKVIVTELESIYIVKIKPRVLPIYENENDKYWRRIDELL